MSTRRITTPVRGESLVGIEPELLQHVAEGWLHRMSLYTGRALTAPELSAEQQYRSGHIASLAQLVTPGVGAGLDAHLDGAGNVRIAAGYGFSALGEDVTLTRELSVSFDQLPIVNAVTGAPLTTADATSTKTVADVKKDGSVQGGIFVLLLLPVTVKATGEEIDSNKGPNEVSGLLDSSCTRDPEEYAFEDWEMVDGAQFVLATWPDQAASLTLPDANPASTFRNRLVYTIYNAEMQLGSDQFLPWQTLGVALGVAAFDASWNMLFFDRNAVVRSGGRAREGHLLFNGSNFVQVSRAVAEARLLQVMEQNAEIQSEVDFTPFINLPPTAILPAGSLDLVKRQNVWFPKTWKLHVGPIHAEEVETALRSQIFAAPFDLTQAEEADLLLPLTDDVYDPNILIVESLAPEFTDELNKATAERNLAVQHRFFLQQEANVLLQAQGEAKLDTDTDLNADEQQARNTTYTPAESDPESYGTVRNEDRTPQSQDILDLHNKAGNAPYTIQVSGNSLPLFTADDLATLDNQGVQAFIDAINTRIKKIDDLLNIHFLQTQTNIYRYRTNVLDATAAARLVTSPIIANIAQRESAVATAQDLAAYITSITPGQQGAAAPTTAAPGSPATTAPLVTSTGAAIRTAIRAPIIRATPGLRLALGSNASVNALGDFTINALAPGFTNVAVPPAVDITTPPPALKAVLPASVSFSQIVQPFQPSTIISSLPSQVEEPTTQEVSSQLPMQGVAFNIRTLSIAERLKTSPSHEALLYSLSGRTDFLDIVLADDFGITVDDLEILVMEANPNPNDERKFLPVPHALSELRDPATRTAIYTNIQQAGLLTDADESAVFSAGITVLDHHTLLLRAVESRIALYRQFLALAALALTSIQNFSTQVLAAIKQVANQLAQARANLALVTGLLNDEQTRIADVNTRRNNILANVPFVVLTRPRTLQTEANVPSRQLLPASVQSPVPAALESDAIVPPELRELASLLREAPLAWMPAIDALLSRLEHPRYFFNIAQQMQVRAYTRMQLPALTSSATTHPGPYGPSIADVFYSQQRAFTQFTRQRATYNPAVLANISWAAQKSEIFRVAAINDLLAVDSVHLEISREIAELVENVSKMATAMYQRVSATLPADRLQWAEYLLGPGLRLSLRYLTVLPGWQDQAYIEREQMQMLVDWLFAQIDLGMSDASSYMSDLVRTAILLASHAPVTDVIAGEVAARTKPVVGTMIPLASDSPRIARGMTVMFYQGANLTARGVVDDLDAQQSYARVTDVYQQDQFLETNAIAHFLNDAPEKTLITNALMAQR